MGIHHSLRAGTARLHVVGAHRAANSGRGLALAAPLAAGRARCRPGRNLFTARYIRLPGSNAKWSVLKVDRLGRLAWTHRLRGTSPEPSDDLRVLVPTADGDVVAAGAVQDVDGTRFVVARLGGADGRERWRTRLQGETSPPNYNVAYAAAVTSSGDDRVEALLTALGLVHSGSNAPEQTFTRTAGLNPASVIANGSGPDEAIDEVTTFVGTAFGIAPTPPSQAHYEPVPTFPPGSKRSIEGLLQGVTIELGAGRVYVSGESGGLAAQESFGMQFTPDNEQYVLNIVHWLDY
jgi:hypothetical protein